MSLLGPVKRTSRPDCVVPEEAILATELPSDVKRRVKQRS